MATTLKLRRGTTAQHSSFTGTEGEVTVDTDKDTVVVHDGSTSGGFPLARETGSTIKVAAGTVSAPGLTTTGDTNTGIFFPAADQVAVATNGVERVNLGNSATVFNDGGANVDFRVEGDTNANLLFVDASTDRVGVGTSTPGYNFDVVAAGRASGANYSSSDMLPSTIAVIGGVENDLSKAATLTLNQFNSAGSIAVGYTSTFAGFMAFGVSNGSAQSPVERARITSGGEFLVNTTSNNGKLTVSSPCNTVKTGLAVLNEDAGAGTFVGFINSAGNTAGAITQTGTTTVNYGTSSDYRLKENVAPMTGALDKVMALKPCTYTWKEDGSAGEGFIAHELQAVCPDAVVGEKDATEIRQVEVSPAVYEDVVTPAVLDEDGNEVEPERTEKRLVSEAVMEDREFPKYQGVDTSFLVATLTAAIQELSAKNDALEARLSALEAK
jgi:hypothetical protein